MFQTELNLELLVKDEPIWEETIDPSESLTIDHEIDIKPVRSITYVRVQKHCLK